jgi:hypothetical protein
MAYQERDHHIDVLKALSIVLVLIWHYQPIQIQAAADSGISYLLTRSVAFFYFHVTLLAVPTLFTVSLYLFFIRSDDRGNYTKARIGRLVKLYLFWFLVQNAIYMTFTGQLPEFSLENLILGGPDLPYVSGSVFYFLSLLTLLTLLSAAFLRMGEGPRMLFSVFVALATCLYFMFSLWIGYLITYKNIMSYVVYIPVAYCLFRHKERVIENRHIFLAAFIVSLLFEKAILTVNPSCYGRLSIFTGVLTVVSFVFSCPIRRSHTLVESLSKDSLGIFSIHKYALLVAILMIGHFEKEIGFQPWAHSLENIQIALTATTFTMLIVYLLKKTVLRDFVSERNAV